MGTAVDQQRSLGTSITSGFVTLDVGVNCIVRRWNNCNFTLKSIWYSLKRIFVPWSSNFFFRWRRGWFRWRRWNWKKRFTFFSLQNSSTKTNSDCTGRNWFKSPWFLPWICAEIFIRGIQAMGSCGHVDNCVCLMAIEWRERQQRSWVKSWL